MKLYGLLILLSLTMTFCTTKEKEKAVAEKEQTAEVVKEIPVETSIYERLGGADGISSIVDDIVEAHLNNPIITDVFSPLKEDPEHFELFKKHVKEFFAAGTGGSEVYTGKDLPSAHQGLNTTEKQLVAAFDDILAVLNNHEIDIETQKDVLFILYSLKGQVVGL